MRLQILPKIGNFISIMQTSAFLELIYNPLRNHDSVVNLVLISSVVSSVWVFQVSFSFSQLDQLLPESALEMRQQVGEALSTCVLSIPEFKRCKILGQSLSKIFEDPQGSCSRSLKILAGIAKTLIGVKNTRQVRTYLYMYDTLKLKFYLELTRVSKTLDQDLYGS